MTLVANGEGEVVDVEKLCSWGNILVEILKKKRFRVLGLIACEERVNEGASE